MSSIVVVFDRSRDYGIIDHASASREEANHRLDAEW